MNKEITRNQAITANKAEGIIPAQNEDRLTGVVGYNKLPCNACDNYTLNCMTGWTGSIFHVRGECTCGIGFKWHRDLGSKFDPTICADESNSRSLLADGLSEVWRVVMRKRKNSSAKIVWTPNVQIEWKRPNV